MYNRKTVGMYHILFVYFVAAALAGCTEKKQPLIIDILSAADSTTRITAETAISEAEQHTGFMHRTAIPDGTGMLFIYTDDRQLHFWMKDTPLPLSIAFIDSHGVIREIRDMQPFSLEVLSSTRSVRYALEVPQGFFDRNGIRIGDALTAGTMQAIKILTEKTEQQR